MQLLLHPGRRLVLASLRSVLTGGSGRNTMNAPPRLLPAPARSVSAAATPDAAGRGGEVCTRPSCGCAAHAPVRSPTVAAAAAVGPTSAGLATAAPPPADAAAADHYFMGLALDQARAAAAEGEVPVGAVLVRTGPPPLAPGSAPRQPPPSSAPFTPRVLAADRNRVEASSDATAHAEMLVLRAASACSTPGGWRLGGTTLYVTLEPCAMCAGALLLARIDRLVYGAPNPAAGADGGWVGLLAAAKGEGGGGTPGLARASADGESDSEDGDADDSSPFSPHASHPSLVVTRGVRGEEAGDLLRGFFRARRAAGKKEGGGAAA